MQTQLPNKFLQTETGQQAEKILRNCVHCGFCNATCPTYQLLGDELDGPRGRIYLIKNMLEGATPSRETQQHLDRCLTCRAWEGKKSNRLTASGKIFVSKNMIFSPPKRWAACDTPSAVPDKR